MMNKRKLVALKETNGAGKIANTLSEMKSYHSAFVTETPPKLLAELLKRIPLQDQKDWKVGRQKVVTIADKQYAIVKVHDDRNDLLYKIEVPKGGRDLNYKTLSHVDSFYVLSTANKYLYERPDFPVTLDARKTKMGTPVPEDVWLLGLKVLKEAGKKLGDGWKVASEVDPTTGERQMFLNRRGYGDGTKDLSERKLREIMENLKQVFSKTNNSFVTLSPLSSEDFIRGIINQRNGISVTDESTGM